MRGDAIELQVTVRYPGQTDMFYRHILTSVLTFSFYSSLGAGLFLGCSAKVAMNSTGATGGSSSIGGSTGANGGSNDVPGPSAVAGAGNLDQTFLSTGDGNTLSSGGYWWTYTDHNPVGSQYHAVVSQRTDLTVAFQPTQDSDPSHGSVLRISGFVPPALPWSLVSTQDSSTIDQYWLSVHPDSRIPAYPAAGMGFDFLAQSQPFDATGGGRWVGVAFDMKISLATPMLAVAMPMVGTDLPDPEFNDAFPNQCQYYTATNTPATGYQTCFTDYRKVFQDAANSTLAHSTLTSVGIWKRYCVLYSEVGVPSWANAGTVQNLPAFDPTKLLKVRWDMYQPPDGGNVAPFDISVDNVRLLTASDAYNASNNCDSSMIGMAPGSGGEG